MTGLPWAHLKDFAFRKLSADGSTPLFVTVSGAHLYGFSSPDSDFDVRGCHVMPISRTVSLAPGKETLGVSEIEQDREIDFVSHDAAKYFRLMLNRNGYVMEQVFSPLVIAGGPDLEELRGIARGCMTREIYHHYRGFADTQIRLSEKESAKKAKTLLYLYRVLLTGIHVLETGEIEANLPRLLDLHPQENQILDLIAAKQREAATIGDEEAASHRQAAQALEAAMEKAFQDSRLPAAPQRSADLDAFLIRLRLKTLPRV